MEWLLQGVLFKADFLLLPLRTNNIVLGVQWLCTLGVKKNNILFNFRQLTMKFEYNNEVHTLQGIEPKLKVVDADAFKKSNGTNAQFL